MPYCLVPGCRPSASTHVSYHSLPKNEAVASYWLEVCGRLDLQKSKSMKHAKICSDHFTKSDYKNHLQYALMAAGNSAARPRLKEDAVPTLIAQGWKRIRTVPREIRPAVSGNPRRDVQRQEYVSQALHEYDSGQLSGDTVQHIRTQLKMRPARRPHVQLVQVDCRPDGQILIGGETLREPTPARAAARGAAPVRVLASRGIAEQLSADSADELDAEALRLLHSGDSTGGVTWSSPRITPSAPTAPSSDYARPTLNGVGAASFPLFFTTAAAAGKATRLPSEMPDRFCAAGKASRLPSEMPDRFRAVLGRQRRICSLQLTLGRQTEQLQALQARHELDLEELGVSDDAAAAAAAALFPPADVTLADTDAPAGGDMLLTPATLDEATAELQRLRTEVLELRMSLLESAVAANERALTANSQRANLLTVFTPRQMDILVGRRARSDAWDAEDLRRAIALRRFVTRRQYEQLRSQLRLPLPALRQTAAAAQTEPEKRHLYRRLLDPRIPEPGRAASPAGRLADGGVTAPLRRPGELVVLRGAAATGSVQLGRWDGLAARTEEHTEHTEEHTDYEELGKHEYEEEQVYELKAEQTGEMVEGEDEGGEVVEEEEAEVDSAQLEELLLDQTVTDEVEVGWEEEEESPVGALRSRPMKVAITPAHRPTRQRLEPNETLAWEYLM